MTSRTPLEKASIILLVALATVLLVGCAPYHYPYPNAVTYPPPAWGPEVPYPQQCTLYYPGSREQLACERGARQRLAEEQRRRENEAYRQGRGH